MDTASVQVEKLDVTKTTSAIRHAEERGAASLQGGVCYWNGAAYSEGATICADGNRLRCYSDGTWSVVGTC